jgi:hypothetical protein
LVEQVCFPHSLSNHTGRRLLKNTRITYICFRYALFYASRRYLARECCGSFRSSRELRLRFATTELRPKCIRIINPETEQSPCQATNSTPHRTPRENYDTGAWYSRTTRPLGARQRPSLSSSATARWKQPELTTNFSHRKLIGASCASLLLECAQSELRGEQVCDNGSPGRDRRARSHHSRRRRRRPRP